MGRIAGAAYRVGQFWRGLYARLDSDELAQAAALLGPQALPLFEAMPADAQRHSLNVLWTLRQAGHDHPDLAVAALLHDAGKVAAAAGGIPLVLWLRGPLVLMERFAPRLLRRWAADDPSTGWRYTVYVHLEHAAIGARWAAQRGCSPLACWLIEHHQTAQDALGDRHGVDGEWVRLLAALQWADAVN